VLNAILFCPTDFDNNGIVNINDLVEVLANFGAGANGDTDNDGDTDINDIVNVLSEFGSTCVLPF